MATMPEVRNCVVCGAVCIDAGGGMCRKCWEKEQADIEVVINYVRNNPSLRVKEICAGTGARESLVMRLMRDGRFVGPDGMPLKYPCEQCGAPIDHGRLCEACGKKLAQRALIAQQELAAKADAAKQNAKGRLRSLDMGSSQVKVR